MKGLTLWLNNKVTNLSAEVADLTHHVVVLTGFIDFTHLGAQTLSLTSDDGSGLFIDGALVVDNNGVHGIRTVTAAYLAHTSSARITIVQFERAAAM